MPFGLVEMCADITSIEEMYFLLLFYWNTQNSRDFTNRNLCPEISFTLMKSFDFCDLLKISPFRKSKQQNTINKVHECISRKQAFVFRMKRKKKKANESTASGSRAMHGIFDCSTSQAIPGLILQHKYSLP